ncbi:dihydropteroate synthase [Listeria grayi]|uniref:dihydropteroate synthase n=1 Tax=Listeria grayi TaxID=1641 RepID=UPI0002E3A711|nr:dihydropteroate synthase [Listeria grayi]MBC1923168.1 dihydropteroate synthase [Listeria grayi]
MKQWQKTDETKVMGILNITPDSFSDGNKYIDLAAAVKQAESMVAAGASIIDVGGISTRPNFSEVDLEEERSRVIPVIEAIRKKFPEIWISIDTWRAETAEAAIVAGADLINDQWGGKQDPAILKVAATYNVPICLMHNRTNTDYDNFMEDVKRDLQESITLAKQAHIPDDHIILDPGFGFVKTPEQNLEVLRRIDEIVALGYEVLLGTSKKSTIGIVLDLPVEERSEGTGATIVYGITKGCKIVRVHDVLPMMRMVVMTDAILGNRSIGGERKNG